MFAEAWAQTDKAERYDERAKSASLSSSVNYPYISGRARRDADRLLQAAKAIETLQQENATLRKEIARLRQALIKVRGHTSYHFADTALLVGLLQSIERIVDAELARGERIDP